MINKINKKLKFISIGSPELMSEVLYRYNIAVIPALEATYPNEGYVYEVKQVNKDTVTFTIDKINPADLSIEFEAENTIIRMMKYLKV